MYEWFSRSPVEVAVLTALAATVFIAIPVIGYLRSRKMRRKQQQEAELAFHSSMQKLSLNETDQDVIRVLSRYLDSLDKKFLLLTNQAVFEACANQAGQDVEDSRAASLRVKLGFDPPSIDSRQISTANIPVGASVLLLQKGKRVGGRVLEQSANSVRIQMLSEDMNSLVHAPVEIVYHSASGVYRFSSLVQQVGAEAVHVSHSQPLQHVQRRNYQRTRVNLPVYVKHTGQQEQPVFSHLRDLSAGGACLDNTSLGLAAGEYVSLAFHPDSDEHLSVVGSVVRTSFDHSKAHVSFQNLKAADQEWLYGFVQQQQIR